MAGKLAPTRWACRRPARPGLGAVAADPCVDHVESGSAKRLRELGRRAPILPLDAMGVLPLTGRDRSYDVAVLLGDGAGNGIRTRDFDLGKVALYH